MIDKHLDTAMEAMLSSRSFIYLEALSAGLYHQARFKTGITATFLTGKFDG